MAQIPTCSFRGETLRDVFVVHFDGGKLFLDDGNAQSLAAELYRLAREFDQTELLLNLGNVSTLSTPGLVILVTLHKKLLASGKRLALCNLQPAVVQVLEITKLNRLFSVRFEGIPTSPGMPLCPAA